jgi:dephospho-CoA kinase
VLNGADKHQANRIVLDAALISLWNIEDWFDRLFWVDSTLEERLDRLCRKYQGKIDCTELDRRMRMQEDLFKPPVSDRWFFIKNQGDINSMEKLVKQLTFGN